ATRGDSLPPLDTPNARAVNNAAIEGSSHQIDRAILIPLGKRMNGTRSSTRLELVPWVMAPCEPRRHPSFSGSIRPTRRRRDARHGQRYRIRGWASHYHTPPTKQHSRGTTLLGQATL